MRHKKSIRSLCQLNGYLIIIILHKRILIKLCQICLSSAVRNVAEVNLYFMLVVNIRLFRREYLPNSFFFNKKVGFSFFFFFFFSIQKSRRIGNSRTKDSLLKCLLKMSS